MRPDPVERVQESVRNGQLEEAFSFCTGVMENLRGTLKRLFELKVSILLDLFKKAVLTRDMASARDYFRQAEKLANIEKLKDPRVDERYFLGLFATLTVDPIGKKRKPRHMVLVDHIRQIAALPGEIVECGCFRGLSSWMICHTLHEEFGPFDGTGFHIFDSFQGLSAPNEADLLLPDGQGGNRIAAMMVPGGFACSEADVRKHLSPFPGISYHPGWLPQSLMLEPERRYRFVHLDVDLHEPTLGALEYFYPRLVSGGIIISDDYGWPGCQTAIDAFTSRHGVALEILPNNQAVLRKA